MSFPADTLRPSDGVRLFLLDDAGVLFDQGQQALYQLNSPAAFIWCHLERGVDQGGIARALAETFAADPGQTQAAVATALEQWTRLGLLGAKRNGAAPAALPGRPPGPFAGRREPAPPPPAHGAVRHYHLAGRDFRLILDAEADARLHPALSHLACAPARGARTLALSREGGGYVLADGTRVLDRCPHLLGLAPMVKACLGALALERDDYLMALHAGAVGRDGAATLLPAIAGSGKSTLTAALLAAGWDYLSDDTALLSDALDLMAVPYALTLKDGSWPVLEELFPGLAALPEHRRADGRRLRFLPPPLPGPDRLPVRRIVFPRYRDGASLRLTGLPRAEGLKRLLDHCLAVPRPLDAFAVARLVLWIKNVDCFEMEFSALDEAVAALNGLEGA